MTRRTPRAPAPDPEKSVGLGFTEPPEPERPRYDWVAIAARCRQYPGEWYQVFSQDKATYYSALMQGSIAVIGPATTTRVTAKQVGESKGFEVRSANTKRPDDGPRTTDLWIRYVPEKDTTKKGTTK